MPLPKYPRWMPACLTMNLWPWGLSLVPSRGQGHWGSRGDPLCCRSGELGSVPSKAPLSPRCPTCSGWAGGPESCPVALTKQQPSSSIAPDAARLPGLRFSERSTVFELQPLPGLSSCATHAAKPAEKDPEQVLQCQGRRSEPAEPSAPAQGDDLHPGVSGRRCPPAGEVLSALPGWLPSSLLSAAGPKPGTTLARS